MDCEKSEHDFITLAQTLPHYGGHFYTATWVSFLAFPSISDCFSFVLLQVLKDGSQRDAWLYVSTQGINIYERQLGMSHQGPRLYEMFEWNNIQTLCYSKYYLCILPHANKLTTTRLKKYKLKMNHKKYYTNTQLSSNHLPYLLLQKLFCVSFGLVAPSIFPSTKNRVCLPAQSLSTIRCSP